MSSLAAPAGADDLDDRQAGLKDKIAQSNQAISGYSSQLDAATAEVVASRQALADAQAVLAKATSERDAAAEVDAQMAAELADAEQALDEARTAVSLGKQEVEDQQAKAAADMRTAQQQNTAMLSVGMLFVDHEDAGSVSSRIQWASTLYNANAAEVNRLTELQLRLQNTQTNMATLEDKARVAREAAAAQLLITQEAEAAAEAAEAAVADLVAANEAAEAAAAQALSDERSNNAAMQAEMDSVTQRIQERNAAEAARRAAEQAARAAATTSNSGSSRPSGGGGGSSSGSNATGFPLRMPANGPYTSHFGWRTNPVLGYSELHDGLDIGSACGTPLYAAADGVVTEMYYGGGWGWKLTIDNGWINGSQVSTGYNHAQSYIVSPGQRVSRGQVVGYTGTTGLSTGCHLHFHVWINGQVVNPITYL